MVTMINQDNIFLCKITFDQRRIKIVEINFLTKNNSYLHHLICGPNFGFLLSEPVRCVLRMVEVECNFYQ